MRADYVAVTNYGPSALKGGLLHAIRKSFEFELETNEHLKDYVRGATATANFYASPGRIKIEHREQIENAVQEVFHAPSTQEDTHPSPAERWKLADRLGVEDPETTGGLVCDLFPNRAQLLKELNAEIQDALKLEAAQIRDASKFAVQQLSAYLRDNKDPMGYLQRAVMYLDLGEYEKALADLAKVPQDTPAGREAAMGRAVVLDAMQDYKGVIDVLTSFLKGNSQARTAENFLWIGQCYSHVGQHTDAVAAFSHALAQDENSLWALVGRGRASAALGRTGPALADYNKALEIFPQCPEAAREFELLTNNIGAELTLERDDQPQHELSS